MALLDMLIAARKAVRPFGATSRRQFRGDEVQQLALVRLIQVIGEAARKVSNERRSELREVPWDKVIGMRHRVVHDYARVDISVAWNVLQDDLPKLIPVLESVVPPDEGD
jgi:uncharacterized protein with HEPN domain